MNEDDIPLTMRNAILYTTNVCTPVDYVCLGIYVSNVYMEELKDVIRKNPKRTSMG